MEHRGRKDPLSLEEVILDGVSSLEGGGITGVSFYVGGMAKTVYRDKNGSSLIVWHSMELGRKMDPGILWNTEERMDPDTLWKTME